MRVIAPPDSGGLSATMAGGGGVSGLRAPSRRHGLMVSRGAASKKRRKPLSDADLALLFSNTATLLNSGIPLIKALEALANDDTLEKAAETLGNLIQDIRSGDSFSKALSKHPDVFPPMVVSLVCAGEANGKLVASLEQLTEGLEKRQEIITKIREALTYPAIVLVLGTGAIGFLMVFVVPVFQETYAKANMPLPGITRALIAFSQIVGATWWIGLLLGTGAFVAYRHYRAHSTLVSVRDRILLRLPVFGSVIQGVLIGRFVTTFGTLLAGGISVRDSLALTERVVKHTEFVEMLRELRAAVTRGEGIGPKLSEYRRLVPPLVTRMITLGEQSGDLGPMVLKVGQFTEKDLKRRMQKMTSLVEPLITVLMAAAIGTIAMAIYLPIFDMFEHIK